MVEPRNFKEFDEDDVRSRPPRSSRPRTKDRPDYSQALSAFVIAVDRGRVTCLADNSEITAMKSRELGKKSVVVGDLVGIVGDVSGADGTLARVVNVSTRRNALTRTVDDDAELERMIVANVDQMAIVIERQRDSESQSERMVGSTSTPPPPPPPHHLRADKAQGRAAGARQPDRTACCEGQGWEAVVMAER